MNLTALTALLLKSIRQKFSIVGGSYGPASCELKEGGEN